MREFAWNSRWGIIGSFVGVVCYKHLMVLIASGRLSRFRERFLKVFKEDSCNRRTCETLKWENPRGKVKVADEKTSIGDGMKRHYLRNLEFFVTKK